MQGTQTTETVLRKDNVAGCVLLDFKTYNPTVVSTMAL